MFSDFNDIFRNVGKCFRGRREPPKSSPNFLISRAVFSPWREFQESWSEFSVSGEKFYIYGEIFLDFTNPGRSFSVGQASIFSAVGFFFSSLTIYLLISAESVFRSLARFFWCVQMLSNSNCSPSFLIPGSARTS